MSADTLLSVLRALECELHQPKARRDQERLDELLDPGFREFGRSGAAYERADIFDLLSSEVPPDKVHAQGFVAYELAPSVVLLTYQSAHVSHAGSVERHTNRSSIWRLQNSRWQMVFHQGTPCGAFELEES
jgi:hypothetical protein